MGSGEGQSPGKAQRPYLSKFLLQPGCFSLFGALQGRMREGVNISKGGGEACAFPCPPASLTRQPTSW